VITDKKVNWARKTENGRFITKNNMIYGVNKTFQLWSYDLDEDTVEPLGQLPLNTDDLTNINQTDILLSIRITAKKEVAELVLAN
jgi:transcriptional activator of cad operon